MKFYSGARIFPKHFTPLPSKIFDSPITINTSFFSQPHSNGLHAEAYSEPRQTSEMELIASCLKPFNYFHNKFHLRCSTGFRMRTRHVAEMDGSRSFENRRFYSLYPVTIIAKSSILDVAGFVDRPLRDCSRRFKSFFCYI